MWQHFKLIFIMPAINAVSERSFSGLYHVKDYCRNTMSQCRLNNLMVLKVLTSKLDMKSIITDSEHRQKFFGYFF